MYREGEGEGGVRNKEKWLRRVGKGYCQCSPPSELVDYDWVKRSAVELR